MCNLTNQILGVKQRWTKSQGACIEFREQAVVIHEMEWVTVLADRRQHVFAYSLNHAHVRVIRVANSVKVTSQHEGSEGTVYSGVFSTYLSQSC